LTKSTKKYKLAKEEKMKSHISKIGIHVYAKDGLEAVKTYKKAFELEEEGKAWLDDDGVLIHQNLLLNGELFLSVTDEKHLDDVMKKAYTEGVKPIMMNTLYFRDEDDLRRAYEILYKEGNPFTGLREEGHSVISCDIIDKFGVLWHLCVPKDWNSSFVPK
jgi:uncharacterized glyoxalase superfamily protein PhnB